MKVAVIFSFISNHLLNQQTRCNSKAVSAVKNTIVLVVNYKLNYETVKVLRKECMSELVSQLHTDTVKNPRGTFPPSLFLHCNADVIVFNSVLP